MFGARLAIDVGKRRIGVARADALGALAVPLATVPRTLATITADNLPVDIPLPDAAEVLLKQTGAADPQTDILHICELAAEYHAAEVIVGLPLNLRGEYTVSTVDAEYFARCLARVLDNVPVRLIDERLTTKAAQKQLQAAGRNIKNSRGVIDQAAATVLLQEVLDASFGGATKLGKVVS